MLLFYVLTVLAVKGRFFERFNKDKRLKLIILTKTPFSYIEKNIKDKKDKWACIDLTESKEGREKQSGVSKVLKINNAADPTSLFLILEQFVQRVKPQVIYIESLEPIFFGLNDIEKQRFLKMLNNYLAENKIELVIFDGMREGENES